jgi:hypothetical protein
MNLNRPLALFVLFNYLFIVGMSLYDRSTAIQTPEHWLEAWAVVAGMWYIVGKLIQSIQPPTAAA